MYDKYPTIGVIIKTNSNGIISPNKPIKIPPIDKDPNEIVDHHVKTRALNCSETSN